MSIMPQDFFSWLFSKPAKSVPKEGSFNDQMQKAQKGNEPGPCCSDTVHIVYRGVSDDRLYIAHDRKWQEVKYFRPKNLRVYCQKCRKRIYG